MDYILLSTQENYLARIIPISEFNDQYKIEEFDYKGFNAWQEFCKDLRKYFPGLGRYSQSKNIDCEQLENKFHIDASLIDCVHTISNCGYKEYDYVSYTGVKVVVAKLPTGIIIDYQEGNHKTYPGDLAYASIITKIALDTGYIAAHKLHLSA